MESFTGWVLSAEFLCNWNARYDTTGIFCVDWYVGSSRKLDRGSLPIDHR